MAALTEMEHRIKVVREDLKFVLRHLAKSPPNWRPAVVLLEDALELCKEASAIEGDGS